MREIKKIAQSVVRSQSWSRMMFQKILLKVSVSVMLILCLIDRYEGNEDRYDSFLKVNGTCDVNQINQLSAKYDCFENINRASFAFNQILDGVVFKPVASVYKKLPSPVKSGVSNSLDNLSNLVTIPNNLLQGDFKLAGINSGRFLMRHT